MLPTVTPPSWDERRRRFLEAYRARPVITPAARLACVHRTTVYRWLTDPAFADALRVADEEYYRAHLERVRAADAARKVWREERERVRRPMRCYWLARARAAKLR